MTSLQVGVIQKSHGLRGEVIVSLTTGRTERLDPSSVLDTDVGPLTVVRASRHQNRWRVGFEGIGSREEADRLRGTVLFAAPIDDPDEWFVHELIGAEVRTIDGVSVGACTSVVEIPAYDLLELDAGHLIPIPFVVDVDRSGGAVVVTIDPPEGLFDLVD